MDIATGGSSSYIVLDDGFVYSFGNNHNGQLGDGYAGEDRANWKPSPTDPTKKVSNASDNDESKPVLVTGKNMKVKPESIKMFRGNSQKIEVSFNRFNLLKDDADLGNTYTLTDFSFQL